MSELMLKKTEYGASMECFINRESRIKYYKKQNFIQLQYGIDGYNYSDTESADRYFQIVPVPGTEYYTITEMDPKEKTRMVSATWCSTGNIIDKKGKFSWKDQEDVAGETFYLCTNLFNALMRAEKAEKLFQNAEQFKKIMGIQ